ncbi:MAG: type II toxin-antitoxin system VapC family toxin [Burkholderiaceae bacterium]|nr:type II toxin-antitoxin system VapC family toxin [Burkholderiaceae bacterium]
MKVLLDTHTLIWWLSDDARLSLLARDLIADPANEIFVSAASAWEIAAKHRIGKLRGFEDLVTRYVEIVDAESFVSLPMDQHHALRAGSYPSTHKDPFDRMLAAQSELLSTPLLTNDQALRDFPCRVVW